MCGCAFSSADESAGQMARLRDREMRGGSCAHVVVEASEASSRTVWSWSRTGMGMGTGDGGRGILTKASQEDEGRDGELGASRPTVGRRRRCGGGGGCMARYILMDMDRRRTRPRSMVHGPRFTADGLTFVEPRRKEDRERGFWASLISPPPLSTRVRRAPCTVRRAPWCAVRGCMLLLLRNLVSLRRKSGIRTTMCQCAHPGTQSQSQSHGRTGTCCG